MVIIRIPSNEHPDGSTDHALSVAEAREMLQAPGAEIAGGDPADIAAVMEG